MCKAWEEQRLLGVEEGLERGMEKGMERGIEAFILDKVEDGASEENILAKLVYRFHLSEDAAKRYYEKYAMQTV